MTHVVFTQLFEQYEKGKSYNLERTLANGLCKRGICVPFTVHQKMLKESEQKAKETEEKKAELLKVKEVVKTEKTESKKIKRSEKSVKK